jgi:preprotein translocase subunit SecD
MWGEGGTPRWQEVVFSKSTQHSTTVCCEEMTEGPPISEKLEGERGKPSPTLSTAGASSATVSLRSGQLGWAEPQR